MNGRRERLREVERERGLVLAIGKKSKRWEREVIEEGNGEWGKKNNKRYHITSMKDASLPKRKRKRSKK